MRRVDPGAKHFLIGRRALAVGIGALASGAAWLARSASDYSDSESVYQALAKQPGQRLTIGGGVIDVVFADGAPGLDRSRVLAWIERSAQAVMTYFGRFPVSRVGLLVVADDGAHVGGGTTYGFGHSATIVHVGRDADEAAFRRDWVLVHEMTHLALPRTPRHSWWALEGNAVYVEPIARAQAGQLEIQSVWRWSVEDMPKGEPAEGDRGLDNTPTWGRTYWGGAIYYLLADVRTLRETHGRVGLQDALRAINRKSGGNVAEWTVAQLAAVGDAATGTRVLSTLYEQMGQSPVHVDLSGLFASLGVAEKDGAIVFDDSAPLAWIRRRITQPPTA